MFIFPKKLTFIAHARLLRYYRRMYSAEKAQEICRLIAQGMIMPEIARLPDMPSKPTIYAWLIDHPEFLAQYDIAKEKQMEVFGEMIIDIAKDCPKDVDAVAQAKLLIHTIQWTMGKIKPKKYGDRTTIAGDKDNPLVLGIAHALDARISAARSSPATIEHVPAAAALPVIDCESDETEA